MVDVRHDPAPVSRPGYEPTGEGAYAECPDHGSRLWWSAERGVFYCPAMANNVSLHHGDPYELAPEDVYLEHNEAFRVVNGCLYVDLYDETDDDE